MRLGSNCRCPRLSRCCRGSWFKVGFSADADVGPVKLLRLLSVKSSPLGFYPSLAA